MSEEEEDVKMSTSQAATYLGYGETTLHQSRYTKLLAGVTPPRHMKVRAGKVYYLKEELDMWLSQFLPEETE